MVADACKEVASANMEAAEMRNYVDAALGEAERLKHENEELRKASEDHTIDQCAPLDLARTKDPSLCCSWICGI